ncbi:hypothetical protein E6P70_07880 [Moraxella nonliquefaciens]|jgi:hypothetical protein|uniref:hypothetical protein n=1 Tax=Moraxella nonliquefaciens TaxID=478 RepID=UPI0024A72A21|nr:hypothetical protein [Moraxella nonliquefaciens]MDI4497904.1 hypothetical protein [Moraxella nonliquefaciens]MDI4500511.1 hypothetical protein [Moraxella nonliquefaciens]
MKDVYIDLTDGRDIDIDKDYVNQQIKEKEITSSSEIAEIIYSLKDNTDMIIEKTVMILILSKIMSIVIAIENAHKNNENPIDTLLKKYKVSSTAKYLSSIKLDNGDEPIFFTRYVENNKIFIDINYTYTRWYGLDKWHDYDYEVKINYRIIELFEIVISENFDNLKRIINNTIKARIEWERTREDRERQWKKSMKDHDINLNDPETHFELFGEYSD